MCIILTDVMITLFPANGFDLLNLVKILFGYKRLMGNNLTQNILVLLHKSIFVIFAGNFLCPSLSPCHAPRINRIAKHSLDVVRTPLSIAGADGILCRWASITVLIEIARNCRVAHVAVQEHIKNQLHDSLFFQDGLQFPFTLVIALYQTIPIGCKAAVPAAGLCFFLAPQKALCNDVLTFQLSYRTENGNHHFSHRG